MTSSVNSEKYDFKTVEYLTKINMPNIYDHYVRLIFAVAQKWDNDGQFSRYVPRDRFETMLKIAKDRDVVDLTKLEDCLKERGIIDIDRRGVKKILLSPGYYPYVSSFVISPIKMSGQLFFKLPRVKTSELACEVENTFISIKDGNFSFYEIAKHLIEINYMSHNNHSLRNFTRHLKPNSAKTYSLDSICDLFYAKGRILDINALREYREEDFDLQRVWKPRTW